MNETVNVDTTALRQILVNLSSGHWITTERTTKLVGGGELTCRGFKCSQCGFFRHKRHGRSKFCEECGAKMEATT